MEHQNPTNHLKVKKKCGVLLNIRACFEGHRCEICKTVFQRADASFNRDVL